MRGIEILSEKALSPFELAKRDNWNVFIGKVEKKEPFELIADKVTNDRDQVIIGHKEPKKHAQFVAQLRSKGIEEVVSALKDDKKVISLPTVDGEPVRLSDLQKTADFGSRGGKTMSERQESSLITAINEAVAENKQRPITVKTDEGVIKNVISANKVEGSNALGKEPYADIAVHTKSGTTILLSAKGTRTPSVAGGGVAGLLHINIDIVGNAIKKAHRFYKKEFSGHDGEKFPPGKAIECFIKIPETYQIPILRGTKDMGGPIDYMYIGPLGVESEFNNGVLTLNGTLIDIKDYIDRVGDLYIRIRRRSTQQALDFESVDKHGFPNIFYSKGEGGRRLVLISEKDLPKTLKKKASDMWIGLGE